jgi:hypothetical protein
MAKFVVEGTPVGDGDTSGCCAYGCVVGGNRICVWLFFHR